MGPSLRPPPPHAAHTYPHATHTHPPTYAPAPQDPSRIVGFYPRLLAPEDGGPSASTLPLDAAAAAAAAGGGAAAEDAAAAGRAAHGGGGGSTAPPVFHTEVETLGAGRYNAVLAGAAFVDSATLFPAYWEGALEPARRLVDEVFNCDDLLLNFVAANITRGGDADGEAPAAVQWVRPERRIDISKLSGVGERPGGCVGVPACVECARVCEVGHVGGSEARPRLPPACSPPPPCSPPACLTPLPPHPHTHPAPPPPPLCGVLWQA